MLRIYDVVGKLLNSIKSIYVNGLVHIKVKGGEDECFRIIIVRDRGVSCVIGFSMYIWMQ